MDTCADREIEGHLPELNEDRAVAGLAERHCGTTALRIGGDEVQTRIDGILIDVTNVGQWDKRN